MDRLLIQVGARTSPLSRAQVQEVYQELCVYHPNVIFENMFLETWGDKDRLTSLRTLSKNDFFTKELDLALLNGQCRITIHSAKDLPDPIPENLTIAAITKGVDSADVLVLRAGESLETLPTGAQIATSSERREESVKALRDDLQFFDLRGTIHERLALLDKGEADGVVIAEAALIRLGLTHLNRIRLPGETVPYQGKLAILCQKEDQEMLDLFRCIDSRFPRRILYLGLDLPSHPQKQIWIHYPIIRIQVRSAQESSIQDCFACLKDYSHLIFTSKSAVHAFFQHFSHFGYKTTNLQGKVALAVGKYTTRALKAYGISNVLTSTIETAEGLIDLLKTLKLQSPYFFWPHSSLSRSVISEFLTEHHYRFNTCIVYDTLINTTLPKIDLQSIDEIHFTSPSTVDAFIKLFGSIPRNKILKAIGPITQKRLDDIYFATCQN